MKNECSIRNEHSEKFDVQDFFYGQWYRADKRGFTNEELWQ